ncbi:glycosyltransferase [Pseudalkalibacillus hwajinpoensis]|uniref:glycosyltransferase family 2 protein n=1 Tax=Guptibacillus hwajinpoensis TaxID=208199 RepID=UPI00325B1E32
MSTKVSVIVPVYNAEKYIAYCIESLLNQTLKDCEFIFINDGSTDSSKIIIEEYERIDPRIVLINQQNQGVSSARNAGLRKASGEYVGFVDADDHVMPDMYAVHYQAARSSYCDIVISNFQTDSNRPESVEKYPFPINTNFKKIYIDIELTSYLLASDKCNAVWNKLYRNEVLQQNNIQFPQHISLGEDGVFNLLFMCFAESAKYIDYTGYCYREVKGSATRNIIEKDYFKPASEMYSLNYFKELSLKLGEDEVNSLKSIKLIYTVMSYVHLYFTPTKDVPFITRYKYIKQMINHKYVKEALELLPLHAIKSMGRYEKALLFMIKKELVFGLLSLVSYSRHRNQ